MKKLLTSLCMATALCCSVAAVACSDVEHTVTFDASYGQFDDEQSTRSLIVEDGKAVKEQTVSRDGWQFEYWALNGEEYNFSKKVRENITLTAVWTPTQFNTVSFDSVEGASFLYEGVGYEVNDLSKVPCLDLKVRVELDAFYAGTPVLVANEVSYTSTEGVYTIPVRENTTITAVGVRKDVSNMEGKGTVAEPFLVSRPVDLIKIAEETNAGNQAYSLAYYELTNDIDLKGHELQTIGDGRDLTADGSEYAFFGGNFNGAGYTIKNFEINSTDSPWVGLFGILMAGASPSANASVYHLNLDSYEINATVKDQPLYCGSFAGQGVGANVFVCSATNGTINVTAATNYFAYVGGAMGYQYSVYAPEYDASYVSAISYATISTEINAIGGLVYAAGGISGFVVADAENAPSYINHSYTDSTVTGALLSGGIAGYLGRYTSIVDCYSTGDVFALPTDVIDVEEFNHLYAGGIVAYAENDTIVAECFATGSVEAGYFDTNPSYVHKGGVYGGYDAADTAALGANALVSYNSYYAEGGVDGDVNLLSADFIKNNLNWKEYDWVIVDGEYPVVNLEEASIQFRVTIDFGDDNLVDTYDKNVVPITDIYLPLGLWIANGDMKASFTADTTGKIAVGYYFDAEFTKPVPYSYVPTRGITLYVNFASYSQVAGTYYLKNAYKPTLVQLTLNEDGTFTYTDGNKTSVSTYVYDGESILFNDARFARYACVYENSLDPYVLKNYRATVNANGELEIYDNAFYTQSAPLVATTVSPIVGEYYLNDNGEVTYYNFYSNGTLVYYASGEVETKTSYTYANDTITVDDEAFATYANGEIVLLSNNLPLSKFDAFHGEWAFNATANEKITFNGAEKTWVLISAGNSTSGTYEVNDNTAVLFVGSAQIDELTIRNGVLESTDLSYYKNNLVGTWQDYYYGVTLTLDGVDGGTMLYENAQHEISFVKEAHRENFYTLYKGDDLFAYMQYNAFGKYIDVTFNMLDNTTGAPIEGLKMWRYDDLHGEWISSETGFESISFNGYGAYDTVYTVGEYSTPIKGELTIAGETVAYTHTGDFTAAFTYKSVGYTLTYSPTSKLVSVQAAGNTFSLARADEFNGVTLVSEKSGAELSFNGRSSVNNGIATYTDADGSIEYTYDVSESGIIHLSNNDSSFYLDPKDYYVVLNSSMVESDEKYSVKTVFTGDWAISNSYSLLTISGESLAESTEDVVIKGSYAGQEVTFKKLSDVKLSFVTKTGKTMYVFALEGGELAISPDPEIYYGTYTFCAKVDDMFGDWKKVSGPFEITLSFDGMNESNYTYAYATITNRGVSVQYYYMIAENGDVILSSVTPINETYYNYKVVWCVEEDPLAYKQGNRSFRLVQIDSLYNRTLTKDGVDYTFDGVGTVEASTGDTFSYEIVSYAEDGTEVTVLLDGETEITFPVPEN